MSKSEVKLAEALGEAQARAGWSLDETLGCIPLAAHAVMSEVRRHAAVRGTSPEEDAAAQTSLSLALTEFVNELSAAVSRGHRRQTAALGTDETVRRTRLAEDLLAGRCGAEILIQRGRAVGLDVSGPLQVLLVPSARRKEQVVVDAIRVAAPVLLKSASSAAIPHTVLIRALHGETSATTERTCSQLAAVAKKHGVTLVVSRPCGPELVSGAYAAAAGSLLFADTLTAECDVVEAETLLPAQLLATADPAAVKGIEREVLEPLRRHPQSTKLLAALDALLRCDGSPKAAARSLSLAERTLFRYKTLIEVTTGRKFEIPLDATWLTIAWAIDCVGDKLSVD